MRMVRIDLHYDGAVIRAELEQSPASVRGIGRVPGPVPRNFPVGAGRAHDVIAAMRSCLREQILSLQELQQDKEGDEPSLWTPAETGKPEYGPFKDGGVTDPLPMDESEWDDADVHLVTPVSGRVEDA